VAVVGWWATWPPEPVNGAVVSDRTCYHLLFEKGQQGQEAIRDAVYPPALAERVAPMIRRPTDIGDEEAGRFISVPAEELARPFDFADDLSHFRWALASATSYAAVGEELWSNDRPDLLMVYIEATDSASHLFGHLFRAEGLRGELAEQQARYGRAVEEMYVWSDELLGRLMAAAGEDTTLIVVSDHGFKLGALHGDPSVTRDMRRVSTRAHEIHGIVGMWGRGVRQGAAIQGATQLDVTPTILALLDLPAAQDMPGRVLAGGLDGVKAPPRIASYERGVAGDERAEGETSGAVDQQVIAHLEALGYLDGDEEASLQRQADVDVLLAAGRFEEAADAYRRLIELSPDDPALHLNLGYALEHLDRLDEALTSLDRALQLQPDLALAHYNRGVVLERLGDRKGAVAAFRSAAQNDDTLTSARTALERLTGSPLVYAPTTEEQARAAALAAEASGEARRGDYPRALELLAEAERLWPDCPLVFQYRANVAYLMGDLEAALAALERAAELEPDNVAVRTNLERLRRKLTAPAG
jgi:tetratricopeptide (TPR) repeat protein